MSYGTPALHLVASTSSVPEGTISAFGGSTAPAGYLLCDGSAVSRTTYATLFNAIGTAYGAGDGSTTFNLPDLRGRFLRGVDETAGNDPDKTSRTAMATAGNAGNNIGSVLGDQFASHTRLGQGKNNHQDNGGDYGTVANGSSGGTYSNAIGYSGGNETRPKNAYVNFIIKNQV